MGVDRRGRTLDRDALNTVFGLATVCPLTAGAELSALAALAFCLIGVPSFEAVVLDVNYAVRTCPTICEGETPPYEKQKTRRVGGIYTLPRELSQNSFIIPFTLSLNFHLYDVSEP